MIRFNTLLLAVSLMAAVAMSQDSSIKGPFGTTPLIVKPDSNEKAATLKNLRDLYGADRDITFVSAQSGTGDTASGVVVERTRDRITLDTTPCLDGKRLVTFVAPYKESKIDEQRCETKTFPRSQVIQMGR